MADSLLSPIARMVEKLGIYTSTPAPAPALPPPPPGRVQDDLEKLQKVRSVLQDAEDREVIDASVRLWLRELRAVAYDADDVLDEYDYELLCARAEGGQIQTTGNPATKHEPEVSDSATPTSDVMFWGRMACRIVKIRNRFDEISRQRDALHLREADGERRRRETPLRPPSSYRVNVSTVYGRDDEKKRLIDGVLLPDGARGNDLSVVPIFGMGGVGKTTFAQLVYNDRAVRDHFERRGWICVSDDFRLEKLWKKIIEAFRRKACEETEPGKLQEKLKEEIRWKRFLLVLDDVWNEDPTAWTNLLAPLRLSYGGKGSVVIVTTRSEKVANVPHMLPSIHLGCLSFEHCWSIFWQQVFRGCDISENQAMIETGKKIVEKCKGLPLAVKVLGGLLRFESELEKWEDVLRSELWDLGDRDEILPALKLSYAHLPTNLRQCYIYCSLFPKDFRFNIDQLVHLWMAQGFIQCEGRTEAEDMGTHYFSELLQRSFFQYHGGTEKFVMHDLIHDLAQSISGIEYLRVEYNKSRSFSLETRHLSLVPDSNKKTSILQDMSSLELGVALRTFLVPSSTDDLTLQHPIQIKFSNEMLQNLKFLRALDLSHIIMYELPDSIENLKHLRYLNLSRTNLEMLPESLCKLYHLQTLLLKDCDDLLYLPEGIKELCNLRHLDCRSYRQYRVRTPKGIGKLRNLQTLPTFNVGRDTDDCGIEELKDLNSLRGSLNISGLCYVVNAEDSKLADLKNKEGLHELMLNWGDKLNLGLRKQPHVLVLEDFQMKVLDNLRPPTSLKVLKISDYGGLSFPNWVGDVSFSRLVEVEIHNCAMFTVLPAFGQFPFLKLLNIEKASSMECIEPESRGCATIGFPSLEVMTLKHLDKWVQWQGVQNGDFPLLGSLVMMECPLLRGVLPNFHSPLPMLKELHLEGCGSLESVPLYNLPAIQGLTILRCWQLTSIEFYQPNCAASSSPAAGPPLKQMMISGCPLACFSPDDEHHVELLPHTLRNLNILSSCPLLVEWCTRDGGRRMAHIPTAQFGPGRDGRLFVTT